MGRFINKAVILAFGIKEKAEFLKDSAKKIAQKVNEDAERKSIIKKRETAKNAALRTLEGFSKELEAYCANLANSEAVREATEEIIGDLRIIRNEVNGIDPEEPIPESLILLLEEQRAKWLDEKDIKVEGDNIAQIELDRSEIIKKRKMAAKKCEEAIEALRKGVEEES